MKTEANNYEGCVVACSDDCDETVAFGKLQCIDSRKSFNTKLTLTQHRSILIEEVLASLRPSVLPLIELCLKRETQDRASYRLLLFMELDNEQSMRACAGFRVRIWTVIAAKNGYIEYF